MPVSPQHGGPTNGSGAFAPVPPGGGPPQQQGAYQAGYQAPPPAPAPPAGPPATCNLSNVDTKQVLLAEAPRRRMLAPAAKTKGGRRTAVQRAPCPKTSDSVIKAPC